MRKIFLLMLLCATFHFVKAQTPRVSIQAVRTNALIKIDGNLDEEAWKTASHISGLTEMRPNFGKREDPRNQSDLYILYDDNAVYVAGFLHESNRDSIATELSGRDNIGASD